MAADNRSFISIKVLLFLVFLLYFVLALSLSVKAQEQEEENETDAFQNERLNSLETRLEELGYIINDMENAIERIQESDTAQEQERLLLSDKLDLTLIALNDLVNYSIDLLGMTQEALLDSMTYQDSVNGMLSFLHSDMESLNENTVSGNALISSMNDSLGEELNTASANSIQEFNHTLSKTNTLLSYLFVLLLFLLVMVVAVSIGLLLHHMIHKFVR